MRNLLVEVDQNFLRLADSEVPPFLDDLAELTAALSF